MKKTKLALLTLFGITAMSANAAVFIDEHQEKLSSDVIEKVIKDKASPEKTKAMHKKAHRVAKDLKTTNKISTIDYEQKISVFHHIGEKQPEGKIEGFANGITIKEALENVVPNTWSVKVSDKVDVNKKVNFVGGEYWNDVVEQIGKNNFSATLDWNKKEMKVIPTEIRIKSDTVAVTEGLTKGNVKKAVIKKPVKATAKKYTSSQKMSKSTAKSSSNYTGRTWLLSKNYTLRQNIELWAKKAGWTVAWKAPDYKVIADTKFTGEIDSENGPVISILKHYEDATLPLKVEIFGGNKVISVESRHYLPKDSVDLSLDIK